MESRIQKWGNSLALRIPKALAAEADLEQGTRVKLSLVDGELRLSRVTERELTLEELLSGVTEENVHGEWDTGPPVGKEVW